jgi:hypothetical protein
MRLNEIVFFGFFCCCEPSFHTGGGYLSRFFKSTKDDLNEGGCEPDWSSLAP